MEGDKNGVYMRSTISPKTALAKLFYVFNKQVLYLLINIVDIFRLTSSTDEAVDVTFDRTKQRLIVKYTKLKIDR